MQKRRSRFSPDGEPLPVAGVGLRERCARQPRADVAPLCANNIRKLRSFLAGVQNGALPRICSGSPQVRTLGEQTG